jgi:hypothetical protein
MQLRKVCRAVCCRLAVKQCGELHKLRRRISLMAPHKMATTTRLHGH